MSSTLCSMGRKLGDTLWALVNAKAVSQLHGEPVDFMTSAYCGPLVTLLQYQSYIDNVIINNDMTEQIKHEHPDLPWYYRGPEIKGWARHYQYGFSAFPNKSIPYLFTNGAYPLPEPPWSIEYPDWQLLDGDYVVMVPSDRYRSDEVYSKVVRDLPYRTVVLGRQDEALPDVRSDTIQLTGVLDFKQTAAVLARAKVVISPLTSNAVLGSLVGANLVIPFGGAEKLELFGVYTDTVKYVHKPNPLSDEGPSPERIISAVMSFV